MPEMQQSGRLAFMQSKAARLNRANATDPRYIVASTIIERFKRGPELD